VQHGERVSREETRGARTRRSGDADCDVRGGAQARGSGRDAGERSRSGGFGVRVNVESGITLKIWEVEDFFFKYYNFWKV